MISKKTHAQIREELGLRPPKCHDDCPLCGCGKHTAQAEALYLLAKEQAGRLRYYRERDRLLAELRDRGFEANVTLDGSVIITGCRT